MAYSSWKIDILMYYLMIKMALRTNLKYLCYTKLNPYTYKGSGVRWGNHIRKHNSWIITCVLEELQTKSEVADRGLYYSNLYDVENSDEWANLKAETGDGGGFGKVGRRWKIKDTSNMSKSKNRTTERCVAGYKRVSEKMRGDNNPRRKYPATDKQLNENKIIHSYRTELSRKPVKVILENSNERIYNCKMDLCKDLGISYDILNHRLDKNKDYKGMFFKSVEKERISYSEFRNKTEEISLQ